MLAAHAKVHAGVGGATLLDGHAHQLEHRRIDGLEGVLLQDLLVQVQRDELGLGVVAGEAKGRLREVVGAKAEEVGVLGDLVGDHAGARQLEHGSHGNVELDALLGGNLGDHALDDLAGLDMFGRDGDKRNHDLGTRVDTFLDEAGGSRCHGANLHERQVAKDDGQTHAAQAEHRVGLDHAIDAAQAGTQDGEILLGRAGGLLLSDGDLELAGIIQELMQGRVEQAHDHIATGHGLKHGKEVLGLNLEQIGQGLLLDGLVIGQDEALDDVLAVAQEHVLGAAQTDGLGAKLKRELGILGVVGVDAHVVGMPVGLIQANLVSPGKDGVQIAGELGGDQVDRAVDNDALSTVDGDDVTLVQYAIAALDAHDLLGSIDMEALDTADAGRTHAAGDNCGMARLATVARQDTLGGNHALQVVRVGLPTDQDDLVTLVHACDGIVAREHDLAHGSTGTGVKAAGQCLVLLGGVELRVQELVELRWVNAAHGFLAGDEALLNHLDGDTQGGGGGALAHASLEHPELALLDGELDIAHVAIVVLERQEHALELLARGLKTRSSLEIGDGLGVADAGNDVLTLSVDQKVAVELLGAVGRVARKGDAGRGGLALVAKGHRLDVDGGAELVGDAMLLAVNAGALVHPAAKYSLNREAQLELRIVREDGLTIDDLQLGVQGGLDVVREDALKGLDELLQVLGRKLGVHADAGNQAGLGQGVLEQVGVDAHDDIGEHLDKAAIAIPGKARILRLGDEALDGIVVEAQVEDRIHHTGHGERSARAHRYEQRVTGVAELFAAAGLEVSLGGNDLVECAGRPNIAGTGVLDAGLAGNGKATGNRQADTAHLGKVGALTAKDEVHGLIALGNASALGIGAKTVNPLAIAHDTSPSMCSHTRPW